MLDISEHSTFQALVNEINNSNFDCDNEDLNEFFIEDALNYSKELIGKTYSFILDEKPEIILGAFTVSNDSLKVNSLNNGCKKRVRRKIPHAKYMKNYPAVLIGRLGVHKDFKGQKVGSQILDFIKLWFTDGKNKTGCRFIIVDAYNNPQALKFYESNGFKYLHTNEETEKEHIGLNRSEKLLTRFMYFDLIQLMN
nr:GNAT family N-acetyltransferase [uncultured Marinifilum sp.]